jgi:pimeloyl-ACP methyl ester carboxylesterase
VSSLLHTRGHVWVPRTAAIVTAAGLIAACAIPATAATSTRGAEPPARATGAAAAQVPKLHWTSCHHGFQCTTARVPLDYRHPDGTKINIAVVRHLATDPARRIGSLFVNGGGPDQQIEGFLATYPGLPATLRQRFDIITFDPRGFGLSTAVRCFPSTAAERQFLSGLPPFPVGARQESVWERTWAEFDARCARHNAGLLDHDTTANVARDMNLLREAVGARLLNFVGLSYASGLGAVYANLFPAAVGRMVLDANLDPVAWTKPGGSLTTFLRLHSDQAKGANMTAFLRLCGQTTTAACAFSAGTPSATRAKWKTLSRRLNRHPVTAGNPARAYTYADAVTSLQLCEVSAWPEGARLLEQLWAASTRRSTAPPAAIADYTGEEQQLAVLCSDSPNPRSRSAYAAGARLSDARSGGVGQGWVWATEACARWPGHGAADRYTGPWDRPTAHPLLLLGNTGDTNLPYRDTLAMQHDLARARLLTIAGYGHTELSNPSTCALNYELSYLQTGSLPPAGTVCPQDTAPFPAP